MYRDTNDDGGAAIAAELAATLPRNGTPDDERRDVTGSLYTQRIRETMAALGRIGAADPRHVEAYMRLEHSTLDGLSPRKFREEVALALECIAACSTDENEEVAASFGL